MKKFRWLQFITGVHYIHNSLHSYGFKIPFTKYGYFKKSGIKKHFGRYHDCTLTNKY